MADVLIVDDEQSVAEAFSRFLTFDGHVAHIASSGEDALRHLDQSRPDLVVMDVRMPGMDGLQALVEMRRRFPDLYVVIMTAFGTSQTSIDAIRAGAFDYLTKPLDLDHLRSVIQKALASQQVRRDLVPADPVVSDMPALIGDSASMQEVYKLIGRLASNDVPALVVGERGTGKDLAVSAIHHNSARRDQPLVIIDCALTPESELEPRVFSAAEGTIHLSGVEHLPMALQLRLARSFVNRGMRTSERPIGARVIASTETPLASLVEAGAFSVELHDFLSVITVTMPPLRERRGDIALLAREFARRFSVELGRPIVGFADDALAAMSQYAWPGNVAELEYAVKRACVITNGDVVTLADIGDSLTGRRVIARSDGDTSLEGVARAALHDRLAQSSRAGSPYHDIVTMVEEALVREALQITRGNQVKASELLGLNRATLRKKTGSPEPFDA